MTDKLAQVLIQGDLSQLSSEEKTNYYLAVCESLKLNPYTKPFAYLAFEGGEQLYARKDATDQLRKVHKVSITGLVVERQGDAYIVTASARTADGRTDVATGVVTIKNLFGNPLANAMMRAETKAKRRVTLSICGLGLTDESELDTMVGVRTLDPELPEPAEAHVPTREQDPEDELVEVEVTKPANVMVTSQDDRLWQRWMHVRTEALRYGVVPPNVGLPCSRTLLIDAGLVLSQATEAKKKLLSSDDSERTAWEINRTLMAEAYAKGLKLKELPGSAPLLVIQARNEEIKQLLEP